MRRVIVTCAVVIIAVSVVLVWYNSREDHQIDELFSHLRRVDFVLTDETSVLLRMASDDGPPLPLVEHIGQAGRQTSIIAVTGDKTWAHKDASGVIIGQVDVGDFSEMAWSVTPTDATEPRPKYVFKETLIFGTRIGEMEMKMIKKSWSNGRSEIGAIHCSGCGRCKNLGVKLVSIKLAGEPRGGVVGIAQIRFRRPSSLLRREVDTTCAIVFH